MSDLRKPTQRKVILAALAAGMTGPCTSDLRQLKQRKVIEAVQGGLNDRARKIFRSNQRFTHEAQEHRPPQMP